MGMDMGPNLGIPWAQPASGGGQSSLLTGLVDNWFLRYPVGSTYPASVNSANNLAQFNSPGLVVGPQPVTIPHAAGFATASSQSLTASYSSSLDFTAKMSAAFFVKPSAIATEGYLAKGAFGVSSEWAVLQISGNIYVYLGNTSNTIYGNTTDGSLYPGANNHIAFTYDGTQAGNAGRLNLWVNGVQKSLTYNGTIPATISPSGSAVMSVGQAGGADYFSTASVGPLGLWSVPISSTVIAGLYALGAGVLYANLPPGASTGLVSWYDMQEATGATRVDSIGSNNLTSNNGVTQTTGVAYNAVKFTAANSQYLSLTSTSAFSGITTKGTWSFWIDSASYTAGNVALCFGQSGTGGWYIQTQSVSGGNGWQLVDGVSGASGITPSVATGSWVLLTAVYDGTQTGNANRLKTFINGTQQTLAFVSGNIPSSITAYSGNFYVSGYTGNLSSTYCLNAGMQNLTIWTVPLTQAQITALYGPGYPTVSTVYPWTGIA